MQLRRSAVIASARAESDRRQYGPETGHLHVGRWFHVRDRANRKGAPRVRGDRALHPLYGILSRSAFHHGARGRRSSPCARVSSHVALLLDPLLGRGGLEGRRVLTRWEPGGSFRRGAVPPWLIAAGVLALFARAAPPPAYGDSTGSTDSCR